MPAKLEAGGHDALLSLSPNIPKLTRNPRRVDDKKEAERQAHLQRKAAEAARVGRGRVDPFPLNVLRSRPGHEESEAVAPQSSAQAPTLPLDFNGINAFYSAAPLEVLLAELVTALTAIEGTPIVTVKHKAAKVRNFHNHVLKHGANTEPKNKKSECHISRASEGHRVVL